MDKQTAQAIALGFMEDQLKQITEHGDIEIAVAYKGGIATLLLAWFEGDFEKVNNVLREFIKDNPDRIVEDEDDSIG